MTLIQKVIKQGCDVEEAQKNISTFNDWLAYFSLKTLIFFTKILPKSWTYAFMRWLTSSFRILSKRRRRITEENLQKAFPEMTTSQVKLLSKEVFAALSKTVSEILFLITGRFDIDDAIVNKDEALETLARLRKTYPQGWIFMTAHFSNWELGAHFLAKEGYAALAVGREGDNKLIDQKIITPFRQQYGNGSIFKKNAAIGVFKALKRGNIVGILIDQKVNEKEGVKVKFFNRDVYTTSLVATMQEKMGVKVIPVFLPRISEGKYKLIVGEPLEQEGDIVQMTQAYNDSIENIIRDYPEQWFWMHNRWKV